MKGVKCCYIQALTPFFSSSSLSFVLVVCICLELCSGWFEHMQCEQPSDRSRQWAANRRSISNDLFSRQFLLHKPCKCRSVCGWEREVLRISLCSDKFRESTPLVFLDDYVEEWQFWWEFRTLWIICYSKACHEVEFLHYNKKNKKLSSSTRIIIIIIVIRRFSMLW